MSRMPLVSGLAATLFAVSQVAAQVPPPTIRSATLSPATGVLRITGEHLGPGVQVLVDGQAVTSLPGATDAQVDVQVPVAVLATPGAYRLVVYDPVRKAWDGFVVVSGTGAGGEPVVPAGPTPLGNTGPPPAAAGRDGAASSVGAAEATATSTPLPLSVIEDPGGQYRTALGYQALLSNTTGYWNTALGYQALHSNTIGSGNTAVGFLALKDNPNANNNTAVGFEALKVSTGNDNTALGFSALRYNMSGTRNTALGESALYANVDGDSNTAVGMVSMSGNDSGSQNVAFGESALRCNTAGSFNVAMGNAALDDAQGSYNTALGWRAGDNLGGGSHNVYLGASVAGVATDAHTMRLGLPYTGTAGQNRTFIAGIRGTSVTGGEGVYIDANGQLGSGPVVPAANTVGTAQVIADSLTAADLAPASVGTSEIADKAVTAAKVDFAFAGLGANTFAGTQTIGAGNLDLGPSSATAGNLTKNGVRFLHNPGALNTFLGRSAGSASVSGSANTAIGDSALSVVTTAARNTGTGYGALLGLTAGTGNTANGYLALFDATTGSMNTAIGHQAGSLTTTGSHNIFVGAGVSGAAGDANTMRLGLPYNATTQEGQNKTFIAGVAGTVLTGPAVQVFIDGNGQLGTLVPAPFTGTINQPVTANPRPDAAVEQALAAHRARIDAQAAVIAELRARVSALEAAGTRRRR